MLFPTLLGAAVFAGLVTWLVQAHSAMWRRVASAYAGRSDDAVLARKFPEQVLIAGHGIAFRSYVPVTVRIHEKGISLTLWLPFSLACPPLFLPFDEMSCRRTDWYLNAPSFAIRLARAEVDVIVGDSLWNWIESNSELRLSYAVDAAHDSRISRTPAA